MIGAVRVRGLLIGCLVGTTGLVVCGSGLARGPSGDPRGLALLARVHAAYRHVPAVEVTGRNGAFRAHFSLLLHSGVATAEGYVGTSPVGVTRLVARGGGPTYAREPGTACWRKLRRSDSQSLTDIGTRFPDVPHMRVKAPRRVGSVWLLPFVAKGHVFTLRISTRPLQLETLSITERGKTVTEHEKALQAKPTLPVPTPSC